MKNKGIIFDMDGTLLDSMYIWNTLASDYIKSMGIEPILENREMTLDEIVVPMSLYESALFMKEEFNIGDDLNTIMNDINSMVEKYYFNVFKLKKGVLDFIKAIYEKKIPMAIATATEEYLVKAAMKRCGVLDYFDYIYTCGMAGVGKDNPDIFIHTANAINCDVESSYVVEDSFFALKTAKAVGFKVIGVFDEASKDYQGEIEDISDYYINDTRKIIELIDIL